MKFVPFHQKEDVVHVSASGPFVLVVNDLNGENKTEVAVYRINPDNSVLRYESVMFAGRLALKHGQPKIHYNPELGIAAFAVQHHGAKTFRAFIVDDKIQEVELKCFNGGLEYYFPHAIPMQRDILFITATELLNNKFERPVYITAAVSGDNAYAVFSRPAAFADGDRFSHALVANTDHLMWAVAGGPREVRMITSEASFMTQADPHTYARPALASPCLLAIGDRYPEKPILCVANFLPGDKQQIMIRCQDQTLNEDETEIFRPEGFDIQPVAHGEYIAFYAPGRESRKDLYCMALRDVPLGGRMWETFASKIELWHPLTEGSAPALVSDNQGNLFVLIINADLKLRFILFSESIGEIILPPPPPPPPPPPSDEERCGLCTYMIDEACHRYPPVPINSTEYIIPGTNPFWWCGEFRRKK